MESEVIFSRSGYEYRYRIGMDDEMISSYRDLLDCSKSRSFILEVRTNFVLKKNSYDEEIIGSERFAKIYPVNLNFGDRIPNHNVPVDETELYRISISYRLREYWLPEKEIVRIAREAFCFVKRMAADPQNASLLAIPVVVYIDVCTVQLQGESLDATIIRSIKSDCLIPFQVWGMSVVLADGPRPMGSVMSEATMAMSVSHRRYLLNLPRKRVEDVADAPMESCRICLQPPTYGTQITPFSCDYVFLLCDYVFHNNYIVPRDHVFHNHCIVRWLMKNKTCPVCQCEIAMESP